MVLLLILLPRLLVRTWISLLGLACFLLSLQVLEMVLFLMLAARVAAARRGASVVSILDLMVASLYSLLLVLLGVTKGYFALPLPIVVLKMVLLLTDLRDRAPDKLRVFATVRSSAAAAGFSTMFLVLLLIILPKLLVRTRISLLALACFLLSLQVLEMVLFLIMVQSLFLALTSTRLVLPAPVLCRGPAVALAASLGTSWTTTSLARRAPRRASSRTSVAWAWASSPRRLQSGPLRALGGQLRHARLES